MCKIDSYDLDICTYIDYELCAMYSSKDKKISVDLIIELCFIYIWYKLPEDELKKAETCRRLGELYVKVYI